MPIHLEVPADAAIELWDSGLPVAAHAGDTLKTMAATYHVPLWALAQINSVSASEPLSEGQRIVVPRYLAPNPGAIAEHCDAVTRRSGVNLFSSAAPGRARSARNTARTAPASIGH